MIKSKIKYFCYKDSKSIFDLKKHIPNIITLFNAFFGGLAIISLLGGAVNQAIIFFFLGLVADFLDGSVARALEVSSDLGKELDSLADMISFGLFPGLVYYTLLAKHGIGPHLGAVDLFASIGLLVTALSVLRLGKFNLDSRQRNGFIGLATPASTILAVGVLLIHHNNSFGLADLVASTFVLIPLILIVSWLLVAEIPMFSLKFQSIQWVGNEIRIIFVLIALIEGVLFQIAAPAIIVITYLLLSFISNIKNSK